MSPSKILFVLSISFVVGIFLESVTNPSAGSGRGFPQIFLWGFLFVAILIICISLAMSFPRKRESRILKPGFPIKLGMTWTVLGFCILFLAIGILRVQISEFSILNDKLSKFNGKGQVVLAGIIYGEPDVRDTFQKLKVKVADSIILVTTKRYPEYKYLDNIKITGKLETPSETEDFSYKNYLMKDGIYSVINFPKIEIIGKAEGGLGSNIYSGILFCKDKIRKSIQRNFLPPQSSILEGTILGDNGAMSQDLKNKLNITGLRHIIAVSGTHVVILSSIIMSLLVATGLWRGKAFYVAVVFICIYIILTGLPASGVRAGIMGVLYLLAQKLGRQSAGSRVIIMACSVMLAINPLLLFYDVGFQLSFLAVLGLIYLEPPIKFFVKTSAISATFAAQIFTLPIMIYNFGNISFVSPITNLLIAPVVYGLMVFGFLVSVAGIFSNALAWILFIPCWVLLKYFVWVIDFFSQPWAMKTLQNVHWLWLAILYIAIIFVTAFLNKKYSQKFI